MFPEGDNIILTLDALKSPRQGIKLVHSPPQPQLLSTMIPQATDKTNNKPMFRHNNIQRLNSAPILNSPSELPPIKATRRPSTPNVVSQSHRRTSTSSTRSLPRNYRINLDLTPLVEVGAYNTFTFDRKRQNSVNNDRGFDIFGMKQRSVTPPSPTTKLTPNSSHSTLSSETLEHSGESLSQVKNKETMILNWLQSIEHTETNNNNDDQLLPSIKEGQPS